MTRAALVATLALAVMPRAAAQESRPDAPERAASRPATIHADVSDYDAGERCWFLIGAVRVRYEGIDIRCDSAILWAAEPRAGEGPAVGVAPETRKGEIPVGAGLRLRELYAEGSVLIRQGEEVHRCEAVFLDFARERGIIVDPASRIPITGPRDEPVKLHVKADELRVLSQYHMRAIGVRTSTCLFGNPHYHVASETVDLYRARAREGSGQGDERRPSFTYTATGNMLRAGSDSSFPVLWMPDIAGDSDSPTGKTYRYLKSAQIGHSSEFGFEAGIGLGDDLLDKDGRKWGSWLVDLHEFTKRGPGIGVDIAYEQPCFKGDIRADYQRDDGEDRIYGKPSTEDRGRFSIRHRHRLPYDFQFDFEANFFSDPNYYPTYFENQYKEDKPPETYGYLKRAVQNSAVTGLFSVRGNDWETLTEYRPRLEYLLITEPVIELLDNPLYFTMRAEFSRTRTVFDTATHTPTFTNVRADADTLVEYPFFAGPVKLTPFLGLRTTYYEHDLFGRDDRTRTGFTYGGEASMILSRTYPWTGGLFNLDGLRHVIEPSIEYRRITGVELTPDELFIQDENDLFDDMEAVTLRLRNLAQTVRHRAGKPASVTDLLDIELTMAYFPDAAHDHGGDPWSNLRADIALRPSDELQLLGDFEWNPYGRGIEEFNVAAGWLPSPEFQGYVGFRHFDGEYDTVFAQANWRASEKWLLRAYSSYDLERDESVDHELQISRIGHDWVFSLIFHADFGQDDFSIGIGVEPRILFDMILRPGGRRRNPEFQYLGGSWLRN